MNKVFQVLCVNETADSFNWLKEELLDKGLAVDLHPAATKEHARAALSTSTWDLCLVSLSDNHPSSLDIVSQI